MTPRKPFEKDVLLQDWIKLMYEKTEEHSKEINELRLCQAKKMEIIHKDIQNMKDELKDVIQKHWKEQETTCRYNHDKVDIALETKLPKWIFVSIIAIAVTAFTWVISIKIPKSYQSIRIPVAKPTVFHKDKSKYTRKQKHRKSISSR